MALVSEVSRLSIKQKACFNCGKPGHFARDCRRRGAPRGRGRGHAQGKPRQATVLVTHEGFPLHQPTLEDSLRGKIIYDTGAEINMCGDEDAFDLLSSSNLKIQGVTGNSMQAAGVGTITIVDRETGHPFTVTQVYHVPELKYTIISGGHIDRNGGKVSMGDGKLKISSRDGESLYGSRHGKIFYINAELQTRHKLEDKYREKFKERYRKRTPSPGKKEEKKARVNILERLEKPGTKKSVLDRLGEPVQVISLIDSDDEIENKEIVSAYSLALPSFKNDLGLDIHQRFGHISNEAIVSAIRKGAITGISVEDVASLPKEANHCDDCNATKAIRKGFKPREAKNFKLLETVHADLVGPLPTSREGYKYAGVIIDRGSKAIFALPLREKSAFTRNFIDWIARMERLTGHKLKNVITDNGGEFVNKDLRDYCNKRGIQLAFTVPYNPEQNGSAERAIRTLLDMVRPMIKASQLPAAFWADALKYAEHIKLRMPTKTHPDMTPYEMILGKKPDISYLVPFGRECWAHIPKEKRRGKFADRAIKGKVIGIEQNGSAYKIFTDEEKIITSRSVIFKQDMKRTTNKEKESPESDSSDDDETSVTNSASQQMNRTSEEEDAFVDSFSDHSTPQPRQEISIPAVETQSERERSLTPHAPHLLHGETEDESEFENSSFRTAPSSPTTSASTNAKETKAAWSDTHAEIDSDNIIQGKRIRKARAFIAQIEYPLINDEPKTVAEIEGRPDAADWHKAMDDEYNSLMENDTWELVDLPPGRKVVQCKWVFKQKISADGTPTKKKARLVAKGFTQTEGVDYFETYAPVAKIATIRFLIAFIIHSGWKVRAVDVVTAYLNGKLKELIYMQQPPGKVSKAHPKKVCRVKRGIYGLKQSGREWNSDIDDTLTSNGYVRSEVDRCVYTLTMNGHVICVIVIYVDDILIATDPETEYAEKAVELLKTHYKLTDNGELTEILGIKVTQNAGSISMCQPGLARNILKRFKMDDCKEADTPMDPARKLTKKLEEYTRKEQEELDTSKCDYRAVVGSLMYLATSTRPDLSTTVGILSKYTNEPKWGHWNAAMRALRFLKGTQDVGITFNKNSTSEIIGYSDSDWAGDTDTRKSTYGYVFTSAGGPIMWKSKKSPTIATSTAEAEYTALYHATTEAIWLRNLEGDITGRTTKGPTTIYCDNQSAIAISKNPQHHQRTKHFDIKWHWIREQVENGNLKVEYLRTDEMVADILTKPLSTKLFTIHSEKLVSRICGKEGVLESLNKNRLPQMNNLIPGHEKSIPLYKQPMPRQIQARDSKTSENKPDTQAVIQPSRRNERMTNTQG
jgi:hypothetical protein